MTTCDPFADIRDKRMSELNEEQTLRATELWLRTNIGPSEGYWYPHLQVLFKIIDSLRESRRRCPCGDRAAALCPGQWEPGCDLGANEKYVRVSTSEPLPIDREEIDDLQAVDRMVKRAAEEGMLVEVVTTFGGERAFGATVQEAAFSALYEWDIA